MTQETKVAAPAIRSSSRARRVALGGLLLAATCLGIQGQAVAADPGPDTLPIHVIALQTADADDQAEALTKAMRSAVRAMPGWSLGEGDNALEVLVLKLQCTEPPDASCQSRIGDLIKADRYIWGIINKKDGSDNVAGELNYWVRGTGASKIPLEYSANLTEPTDDALRKVTNDALVSLTGGPPKGQLHVKAGTVSGQVFVDDQPVGALTNGEGTFSVPSGPRKVTVKAPGFSDAETSTVVKPTGTVDVALTPHPAGDSKPVDFRKVGGFIGIGAGALLVGLGVVSSLQVDEAAKKLGTDPVDNPGFRGDVGSGDLCSGGYIDKNGEKKDTLPEAMDACNAGVFVPLQFVFYGLGAVVGGTGVYLLMTSGTSSAPEAKPATGWTFTPVAGPRIGGFQARYTF
ncbi:MAG: carboxypeptidase-like regulatory domain-containing protein [Polyangiaceae bacterium]